MPISTLHPKQADFVAQWKLIRDAFEGEDAVKASKDRYLPKPDAFTDAEYQIYLQNAMWFNATGRTVDGMVGFVFRKDPVIEHPDSLTDELKDITLNGQTLEQTVQNIFQEVWLMSRVGVLVDHNGVRPYWSLYETENIINWRVQFVQGQEVLQWVVLRETVDVMDPGDMFKTKEIEQYRFLFLDPDNGGRYTVRVFRMSDSGDFVQFGTDQIPTRKGAFLEFIPFYVQNGRSQSIRPIKSYIYDLVRLNMHHYRIYANYLDSMYLVGQPMLWLAGFDAETKVRMGSRQGFNSTNVDAKAGYLELEGHGLEPMARELERIEKLMVVVGSRLLEVTSRGVEKPETLRIRRAGEDSLLGRVSKVTESNVTKILRVYAWWAGASDSLMDDTIQITLNKDFNDSSMTPSEAESFVRMWQSAAISYSTLYHNLEAGELTRPGVDADTERGEIAIENPETEEGDIFDDNE